LVDDEVDRPADALVIDADGHDIVTVMGNRRSDGAAFEAEALYKRLGYRGRIVAIDHDDLQDVLFRIAVEVAVGRQRIGDRYNKPVGDQLAVERLDTIALFYILFLSPFVEGIGEVGDDMGPRLEIVDGLGGQEPAGVVGAGAEMIWVEARWLAPSEATSAPLI
jgi:hypothetical protein